MSIGMKAGTATARCPFLSSHRAKACDARAASPYTWIVSYCAACTSRDSRALRE